MSTEGELLFARRRFAQAEMAFDGRCTGGEDDLTVSAAAAAAPADEVEVDGEVVSPCRSRPPSAECTGDSVSLPCASALSRSAASSLESRRKKERLLIRRTKLSGGGRGCAACAEEGRKTSASPSLPRPPLVVAAAEVLAAWMMMERRRKRHSKPGLLEQPPPHARHPSCALARPGAAAVAAPETWRTGGRRGRGGGACDALGVRAVPVRVRARGGARVRRGGDGADGRRTRRAAAARVMLYLLLWLLMLLLMLVILVLLVVRDRGRGGDGRPARSVGGPGEVEHRSERRALAVPRLLLLHLLLRARRTDALKAVGPRAATGAGGAPTAATHAEVAERREKLGILCDGSMCGGR